MKTLKEVKRQARYSRLVNAVIRRIGLDSVEDVNNHGIGGGFSGFIYYADTVKFFKIHKRDILVLAGEVSQGIGEDMLSMIANFNCLSSGAYPNHKPDYTINEIGEAIYAGTGENAYTIQNAMAWFAAEEVCRMFEE